MKKKIVAIGGLGLLAVVVAVIGLRYIQRRNPVNAQTVEPEPRKFLDPETVYARVSPGVVTVVVKNEDGKVIATGSGFILNEESIRDRGSLPPNSWYVATNYHVIEAAADADVKLSDGTKHKVFEVVVEDESADLAVLCLNSDFDGTHFAPSTQLSLAEETPNIGAEVFAIGSPKGLANTLSTGIISGIREIKPGISWFQTTAPISPGSSGGPLLASNGKVVGITTAGLEDGQNLNFAIPASELRALIARPFRTRLLDERRVVPSYVHVARSELGYEGTQRDPDKLKLLKAVGQIESRKYGDAIATLEQIETSVPTALKHTWYLLLGAAHYELGTKSALARVGRASHAEMVAAFRDSTHGELALKSLTKAIRLDPASASTIELLYRYHYFLNQWPEAFLDADALVKLVPHCATAYYDRGFCYYKLNRYDFALADLRESIRLNPLDPQTHYEIACVLKELHEHEKAIDSFNTALFLKHNADFACHFGIGKVYQDEGKYKQAIRAYEKARAHGMPSVLCDEQIAICRKLMQ